MKRYVGLLLLLLLVVSCQPHRMRPADEVSLAQRLDVLRRQQSQHQSLSALADVRVTRKGKHWSVTQGLLIERPLRLRVDAINFFGQMVFQLAVDGPRLQAFLPAENNFYTGMATQDNVQRFTGVPIAVADLVSALLYSLPPGLLESAEAEATEQGLNLIVAPGVRFEARFDQLRPVAFSYRMDDLTLYEILYDDFDPQSGYPRRMELRVDPNDVRVVVRLDDIELNPELKTEQFQLHCPETAQQVSLDEMEPPDEQTADR